MLKFRQLIKPGEKGRDVKAVKLAYRRIGVQGSGAMNMNKRAGPAFVHTTKNFQRNHNLKADGIYGKATHNHLAKLKRSGKPACSWGAAKLYRTAKLRHSSPSVATNMGAQPPAKQLIH